LLGAAHLGEPQEVAPRAAVVLLKKVEQEVLALVAQLASAGAEFAQLLELLEELRHKLYMLGVLDQEHQSPHQPPPHP